VVSVQPGPDDTSPAPVPIVVSFIEAGTPVLVPSGYPHEDGTAAQLVVAALAAGADTAAPAARAARAAAEAAATGLRIERRAGRAVQVEPAEPAGVLVIGGASFVKRLAVVPWTLMTPRSPNSARFLRAARP
jgi:hypothetical protein